MLLDFHCFLVHFDDPVGGLEEVAVAITIHRNIAISSGCRVKGVDGANLTRLRSLSLFPARSLRSCRSSWRTRGIGYWKASSQVFRDSGSIGEVIVRERAWSWIRRGMGVLGDVATAGGWRGSFEVGLSSCAAGG